MAVVKQTYTRPSSSIEWYVVPGVDQIFINETYPNLVFDQTLEEFICIKTRTGNLEDCQRFYAELQDPEANCFKGRRVYNDANNITYTFELIEDTQA